MKGFYTIFLSEWKLILTKPNRIFMVWVFPILIFAFFGYLFHKDLPENLPVAVTDYDQSPLSRQLLRMLDATSIMQIVEHTESPKAIERKLRTGQIYAYIIIPSDFEKNILQGKANKAICYTNGQFLLPSGFIGSSFMTTVGMFSAGINLNKRLKKGESSYEALATIQSIRSDAHLLYNPYKNYNYFLNLGFIPMLFQMVVMVVSIFSLGIMFKKQQAHMLYEKAGKNAWALLLGKMLPYTILFLFLAIAMDVFLFKVIGIPSKPDYAFMTVFISLLLVLVYQTLAISFVSFSSDLRSALTFGGGFSALAFSFSGYTFPIEGMPTLMRGIAQLFPFTHFLESYVNTAIRGLSITYSAGNMVAFVLFFCTIWVAYPKFVKLIKQNGYAKII